MINYRCKKELALAEYDDDGRCTETIMNVEPGEILQSSDDRYRLIGGPETVHLENAQHWIEIDAETLSEYFEEVSLTEGGKNDAGRR